MHHRKIQLCKSYPDYRCKACGDGSIDVEGRKIDKLKSLEDKGFQALG